MESQNARGSQAPNRPHTVGLSVLVNPNRPTLDIVFVHGFTGHPERTWAPKTERMESQHEVEDGCERPAKFRKLIPFRSSHQESSGGYKNIYWPRDLVPITAPHARVIAYGYDTHVRHALGPPVSKSTVYDIAWDFLVNLEAARRSEPLRPLLFIVHSLGGIIVKETLRRSRGCEIDQRQLHAIFESTAGIIFFGTPHGGADPRGLLQHIVEKIIKATGVSANEQIVNSLLPSSERLRELREDFSPMARQRNWVIYSFQEQYGVRALSGNKVTVQSAAIENSNGLLVYQVVEDVSSCLNDPSIEVAQHIADNHMDMCRFSRVDDPEYGKVVAALNRVLERIPNLTTSAERQKAATEQQQSFLDSLRFDRIDSRHAAIKTAHAKTCKWLLKKSEYLNWLDVKNLSEHHGFLWIKGKPGTGKSTIVKFAFAQAKKTLTDTIIISFFFNARGEYLEKSTIGMYRSLLVQLLEKAPELQSVLGFLGAALPAQGSPDRWDIEILKDLFRRAIEQLEHRRLTCFIDALDECDEDQVRDMVSIFAQLGQFALSVRVQFRVCFSSRHYPHITIEKAIHLTLEGQEGHSEDIANYLHSELKAGHSKLAEQVRVEIIEKASGIFLWVVLVVQLLNKEYDRGRIHALRKRLQEIPAGLHELFKDILVRDCQNMEDLLVCLQWILYSRRPLKQEELYFAILSGTEPDALMAWRLEDITKQDMERFILSSSKGLAEVTKSKGQTVQFIHESVRDFLLKENGLACLWPDCETTFPSISQERLKQCCYNYMKVDTSEHLDLSMPLPTASSTEAANLRKLASEKFPFLEYAVDNLFYHADLAEQGGVPQDDFIEHFPLGKWIILENLLQKFQVRRHTHNADLLYILAERNFPNLIKVQLGRAPNIDIAGERYGYPMLAALANGNENAVRALLMPDKDDFPRDIDSQYHHGFLNLVKIGREIKLRNGQTLLSYAAGYGEASIVKFLLATGKFEPDAPDIEDVTPLSKAAIHGHEAIVKVLLETDRVDPDSKSTIGRTPLSWAARSGHGAVVKLLLETGRVDPDSKDTFSRTPLSWAAASGYEAIVKLLLETGRVDPDSKDRDSTTPLSWAATSGHEAIVKLLLETGRVNPDSKDTFSRTPLSWATGSGHETVVKLLLETGRVDPDSKSVSSGRTPLSLAVGSGYEPIVKLLLETGRVDPDSKDTFSRTPLSWAAASGHEAVVKLLLETGRVDPDSKDRDSTTPLSWAATSGHEAVFKLLLETGCVDPDLKDTGSRTPLPWATGSGHETVVGLLLETGGVGMGSMDDNDSAPSMGGMN